MLFTEADGCRRAYCTLVSFTNAGRMVIGGSFSTNFDYKTTRNGFLERQVELDKNNMKNGKRCILHVIIGLFELLLPLDSIQ
jgi:hypothetical protein